MKSRLKVLQKSYCFKINRNAFLSKSNQDLEDSASGQTNRQTSTSDSKHHGEDEKCYDGSPDVPA